jgi:dTDP-6-deoxy-L-talose 4-dehydrogenase (NAD+)
MKVLVTGATGFVGRHVVAELLRGGHAVTAVARTSSKARELPWFGEVSFIECDVYRDFRRVASDVPRPDVLVHLAWPGLPNYRDSFHLEVNLPAELRMHREAVSCGISRIVVAGTCLEYGMQDGPLSSETDTRPVTAYGLAKDSLRRALEMWQDGGGFSLQWVRLFYMFGEGQNPGSLLAQLDRAIDERLPAFDMSPGDQLRDYLPIADVAACFRKVVENPAVRGVINCCSGRPVSVRDLVERRCAERGSSIRLNRGHFPYPDYEPRAFWGIPTNVDQGVPANHGE